MKLQWEVETAMTHTPKPWVVTESGDVDGPDTGYGELRVATCSNTARVESKGNANLIAAGPDLLEACKRFITAFDSGGYTWGENDEHYGAIGAIREAISKATGEPLS
jgi:hypothetical protein